MTRDRASRVVMIADALPERCPRHAGGLLLREVVTSLDPAAHLTVVVPHGASLRTQDAHPRIDELIVVEPAPGWRETPWQRRHHTYLRTGRAEPWFVTRLTASSAVERAVAAADVVDLQWQEQAVFVPWVRRVNPGARVCVTLHDVLSQVAQRLGDAVTGTTPAALALRARWAWAGHCARRTETVLTGAAPGEGTPDAVAVLSTKDARLLPAGPVPVVVLTPPLGRRHADVRRAPATTPPELLMVALLSREPNRDALLWFATRVLPLVRRHHPDLRLRVAGAGADPGLVTAAREHGVQLLGFVPDLDPLYAAAAAVVVPLRLGAGLKFKTVEALSAGVPVVTTPVGAEGVGLREWFAGVAEDPEDFARAVLDVLADRPAAERRAASARTEVVAAYGERQFRRALGELLGPAVNDPAEEPGGAESVPEVSVVVPAYDAAATLGVQLDTLAHQVAAPPFEVLVVDNRSTDATAEVARRWESAFPCGLRVVPAHTRQGVSHARNRGCHAARAERILICDADDRVQENWVAELAAALEHAPVVGSDAVPVTDGRCGPRESGLRTVFGTVDYVLCGALGVQRRVWAEVGGFDESFPAGHEDVDFCRRVTARGHRLHAVHTTAILYTQRGDHRGRARQAFRYAQGQMLLWTRLADTGTRHPVSFTGSVREALALTARAWRVPRRDRAHALGWAWGIVAGHVRYRVLGRPPAPRLWPGTR
ncbi:glycosyltransferase [Kocuria sp.]|uniref:glycosyltransferase n=1 Tax=Kocuria sp. TaxID=1871328 RepID=UPI0026DC5EA1|nr:glycosyltransferase [Kocuria sp.]MDO4919663.1 glycosyltransferase [Kocuria sp.]